MGESCAIHVNPSQPHQRQYGQYLKAGLERHGYTVNLTSDISAEAVMHCILGPWYALDRWRHHERVLYIDRAYWNDPLAVSIHWLRDGEKVRPHHTAPRDYPQFRPYKEGSKAIYLCDYGELPPQDWTGAVRRHPGGRPKITLEEALEGYHIAAGRRTTALVTAAIEGLTIDTDDLYSPVWPIRGGGDRAQWLNDLAWHNWSQDEIASGEFLDGIGDYNATHWSTSYPG